MFTRSQGAATCVLLKLHDTKPDCLQGTLIGDSGFYIFRKIDGQYEQIYKTNFQKQSSKFNAPYTVNSRSTVPIMDKAEHLMIPFEENDLIIAATDGLFDNVFDKDVKDCLNKAEMEHDVPRMLAILAEGNSKQKDFESPFHLNALLSGEEKYQDFPAIGKQDDITVVLAQIKKREEDTVLPEATTNGRRDK